LLRALFNCRSSNNSCYLGHNKNPDAAAADDDNDDDDDDDDDDGIDIALMLWV